MLLRDENEAEDMNVADLMLLRDCPFAIDVGSVAERRFVCRQEVTLMRPVSSHQVPYEMQLFEMVDNLGFFLFSDCLGN